MARVGRDARKAQSPIQCVGQGLDALMRQRLKPQCQLRPTNQGSCGKRHLDGIRIRIGATNKLFPDFIGKFHHVADDRLRQCRIEFQKQVLLDSDVRVVDLAQHESIKPRKVHPPGSLIQPGIVPTAVGVACAGDTEHLVRMNDLTTVFRQAQGRTFQNAVESHSDLR